MSLPRVLVVLHGSPPDRMGGAGLIAGVLAEALAGLGAPVWLAAPHRDGARTWRGVDVVALGGRAPLGWRDGWTGDPSAARTLLRELRPDVVHVHHLSGWPLSLPRIARDLGARVVLTLHDYAIPCARGQLVDRWSRPCTGPDVRRCAACLAPHLGPSARLFGLPTARDRRGVAARLTAAVDSLAAAHVRLAPSRDLARRMERMGTGPVRAQPLPLPRSVAPAPRALPGPVRFLFCGGLLPTKGPHRLLEAFAQLPPDTATLTLAGPTPAFPADPHFGRRLAHRARAVRGVRLLGPVPHARVPALLHTHDVLVVPSLWPENSPLIVREATAAGLRTILPVQGGSLELDPDGRRVDGRGPGGQDRLLAALVAECHRGRGRRPPLEWPTPEAYAHSLLSGPYTPDSDAGWQRTD